MLLDAVADSCFCNDLLVYKVQAALNSLTSSFQTTAIKGSLALSLSLSSSSIAEPKGSRSVYAILTFLFSLQ